RRCIFAQHADNVADTSADVGHQRTNRVTDRSAGVDLILQYYRQVLDADASATGQPKRSASVQVTIERTGWERQGEAIEAVGRRDTTNKKAAAMLQGGSRKR